MQINIEGSRGYYNEIYYYVTLKTTGWSSHFTIEDEQTYSIQFFNDCLKALNDGTEIRAGDGGNSYSNIGVKDSRLEFETVVSGNGGNMTMTKSFNKEKSIALINQLIEAVKKTEADLVKEMD